MAISWITLKDARAINGATQSELAAMVGVHPKTIVNWEANGVPPKAEYKVRRVLGDELSYLQAIEEQHLDQSTSLEEWKGIRALSAPDDNTREQLVQLYGEESVRASEEGFEENHRIHTEAEQAKYEAALERRSLLQGFSNEDLLRELLIRDSASKIQPSVSNVTPMRQTEDPHEEDFEESGEYISRPHLSAAKKGVLKADEPHAE